MLAVIQIPENTFNVSNEKKQKKKEVGLGGLELFWTMDMLLLPSATCKHVCTGSRGNKLTCSPLLNFLI